MDDDDNDNDGINDMINMRDCVVIRRHRQIQLEQIFFFLMED